MTWPCLHWLPLSKTPVHEKYKAGWKKQLYKSNLIGSFDKLRIFCFILFLNQTKGFEKYSLISCPKHLYLFACALSLIYGGGSRLLPQLLVTPITWPGTLIAPPPLLIQTNRGRRYHYCYPVITASRVWAWDSNPALRHKLPILSQKCFL